MEKEKLMPPKADPNAKRMPPKNPGGPGSIGVPQVKLPEIDLAHLTLDWEQYRNRWELSADGTFYSLRFVFFCTKPTVPDYQYMNIFVPAAYLNADGTVNEAGACRDYTAKTAPVVLHNRCAGWKSSCPADEDRKCLDAGFVFVFCGARSRGLADGAGKIPAPVVDLKAAVRMLRLNEDHIPGDMNKIISRGTSGGGQMSSILGASGNMDRYYADLYAIGAAGMEKCADGGYVSTISDSIYAAQCYCPIADIENADLAYAWMRYDVGETSVDLLFGRSAVFTPFQLALQEDAAQAYCAYLNGLGLKNEQGETLSFMENADGTLNPRAGSYYEQILTNISNALNAWLRESTQPDGSLRFIKRADNPFTAPELRTYPDAEAYFASLRYADQWLERNADGSCSVTDLHAFLCGINLCRNKNIPGFDAFFCTEESDAFGRADERAAHFSSVGRVLEENYEKYRGIEGFSDADTDEYIAQSKRPDIAEQAYSMNATRILLDKASGRQRTDIAKHWRTRNGTVDEHTSFTVAYNLCLAARMAGAESVDYSLVWGAPHGEVDGDGTGSFIEWVRKIC